MGGRDGKLCFTEKDYVEWIMNDNNDCDHNVEEDTVEDPVVCVSRE